MRVACPHCGNEDNTFSMREHVKERGKSVVVLNCNDYDEGCGKTFVVEFTTEVTYRTYKVNKKPTTTYNRPRN